MEMGRIMGKLTDKQRRFAEEYLADLNATQAAIRAGYSENTAAAIGEENLRKPEIAKMIQAEMEARSIRTQISQDDVVQELAGIAFVPVADSVVKVRDKLRALELLGKHLGMFTDRVQMEVHGGVEEYLRKLEESGD